MDSGMSPLNGEAFESKGMKNSNGKRTLIISGGTTKEGLSTNNSC